MCLANSARAAKEQDDAESKLVASASGSIGRADLARDIVPIGLEEVEDRRYSNIEDQLMKE